MYANHKPKKRTNFIRNSKKPNEYLRLNFHEFKQHGEIIHLK